MTNKKSTKRALLTSALALLMCVSMLIGSTFAWFTDSVTSGINKIQSGNLDVKLEHSYGFYDGPLEEVNSETELFKYNVDGEEILWEPGVSMVEYFTITNNGNLALKFKFNLIADNATKTADGKTLLDILRVEAMQSSTNAERLNSLNSTHIPDPTVHTPYELNDFGYETYLLPGEHIVFTVHVMWEPTDHDNDYNVPGGLQLDLGVMLVATQYTYESDSFNNQYDAEAEYPVINVPADKWDGTAVFAMFGLDAAWFDENGLTSAFNPAAYEPADEIVIDSAEGLAAFGALVDAGETFEGKTVKLGTDIDLYAVDADGEKISFNPIGYGYDVVFKGTFDGQSHTISNLYQNGWALGYDYSTEAGGLFASVVDATIKNLTIDGAEIVMECVDMGTLVGYSYGNCTYENISISNSLIANYQRYTGGVVGEVNGTQTFKNVDVDAGSTVSSLWGDFDASLGGIVGGKYGDAVLTFEDCDVACTINAYNDVTSSYQWYAYRRAGMLIGNTEETANADNRTTATASYLTCTNCTVTYDDWANYTYCEFAGTNWPYVRVQAGYSCDAYSNPRYGVATDANGNKAVDDTHVHNDGEDHDILLAFDQLFGGGQGVYGTATHEGVTVIYNNK